ncbi:S49 family peptidase [Sphingomonas sp. CFBP 8760]|uniref:S49 family peptidase n=1 Tax=Sphingomonas sp. CFBP 8760 TaxID=2775282 RepID=UPI001FCE3792|nr:S49 family peptidase [Sphingomonas sp. CFBP 8760]
MHPDALGDLLKRGSIEAMLPDALKLLASMGGGAATAAKSQDPIRDGATYILPLFGPLSPKGSYGGTSTERFANQVREAGSDPTIGAIVVPIMSPGGLVYGTAEAGDAVYETRQLKPVICVASPYSYSAAHWIGTQGSAYYASTSGGVGSVGVRGGHIDMSGFEDKIGMKTTLIASDPEKIAGHPYGPLSDDDRADMQAEIDEMNQSFIAAIARGRGIDASAVPGIHGAGRTFPAARAATLGVTDGVMTLREVVAKFSSSRTRLALMRRRAAAMASAF